MLNLVWLCRGERAIKRVKIEKDKRSFCWPVEAQGQACMPACAGDLLLPLVVFEFARPESGAAAACSFDRCMCAWECCWASVTGIVAQLAYVSAEVGRPNCVHGSCPREREQAGPVLSTQRLGGSPGAALTA